MNDIIASDPPDEQKEKIRKVVEIWERSNTFGESIIKSMKDKIAQSVRSTTPPGVPPPHIVNGIPIAVTKSLSSAPPPAAAAAVPNTASILQALANIAKQKPDQQSTPAVSSLPVQQQEQLLQQQLQFQQPSQQPSQQQAQLMQLLLRQQNVSPNQLSSLMQQASAGAASLPPVPPSTHHRERRRSRSPPPARIVAGRRERSRSPPGRRERSPSIIAEAGSFLPREVSYDNSIPPGTIKVFSRTLFIGGVPPNMNENQMVDVFAPFASVQSVVFNKEKKHAFVKVATRKEAEISKEKFEELNRKNILQLRARWGVGFGPRDCCDYQTGVSIIPVDRLTDADKKWVVHSEHGGTGGRPMVNGICLEEPDIEIGSGVSSKAISKRMPTNGSRNGPKSTKESSSGGFGSDANSIPLPMNPNISMPSSMPSMPAIQSSVPGNMQGMSPDFANFMAAMNQQQQHQRNQQNQPSAPGGLMAPPMSQMGQMGQPGAMRFSFPPQMAAFFQQQQQHQHQQNQK